MLKLPPGLEDRYTDAVHLGSGAMGDVFRVTDRQLGRTVALKTFASGGPDGTDRRRRLEREARYLAGVRHPNVIAVLDFHSEGDLALMVMEYVEGSSLDDAMAGEVLTTPDVVRIVADLADGLAAVHAAGVLHRDLKPGNVLLTREGVPKLADFGLGKLLESGAETELTREGYIVGTLGYIAPEVLLGASATTAADVYGLGVVLYEALTGVHPVGRDEFHRMVTGQAPSPFVPPSRHRPSVNEALDRLVELAMHPDPTRRPPSAAALRDALRAWLAAAGFAVTGSAVTKDDGESTGRFSAPRTAPKPPPPPRSLPPRRSLPAPGSAPRRLLPPILMAIAAVLLLIIIRPGPTDPSVTDLSIETAVVEARATFATATPRRLSIRILDPATGSPVFRVDESDAVLRHTVAATGLRPGTDYLLEIRDGSRSSVHSLRTTVPALTSPPRVLRLDDVFHVTATVAPPSPLRFEILAPDGSVGAVGTAPSGTATFVTRLPTPWSWGRGTLAWRLTGSGQPLATGSASDLRPAMPSVDGLPAPIMGSLAPLGSSVVAQAKDGRLLVLDPSTTEGGVRTAYALSILRPADGRAVHRERPLMVTDGDRVHGFTLVNDEAGPDGWLLWTVAPGDPPQATVRRVAPKTSLYPVEATPDDRGGLLVLSDWPSPALVRIDLATGTPGWTVDLPPFPFVPPRPLSRRAMIRDLGSSPVTERGLHVLAAPVRRGTEVLVTEAAAHDRLGRQALIHVLSVDVPPDGTPSAPRFLHSLPAAAARFEMTRGSDGVVRFPALDGVAVVGETPSRLRFLPTGGPVSAEPAYLGSPIVEAGGRRFALRFRGGGTGEGDVLMSTRDVSLVRLDGEGSPRPLSPALFHEPAGDLQSPAALRAWLWSERYLVAVTRVTATVVDLTTGLFGSAPLEPWVVSDAALTPGGNLTVVMRHEGTVLALPLDLVLASRPGRLTEQPLTTDP